MAEKKNLTTAATLQNLTTALKKTFVKKAAVTAINNKIDALIGSTRDPQDASKFLDENKSVRQIANEELVKQLIAEGADDKMDELQEIAAWIQKHPKDAAAINLDITNLKNKLVLGSTAVTYVSATGTYTPGTTYYTDNTGSEEVNTESFTEGVTDVSPYFVKAGGSEYNTVKAYVEAMIDALNIGDYATVAALQALAGTVSANADAIKSLQDVGATKVEKSDINGNILIDDEETEVYKLPETVLHSTDITDFSVADIELMLADSAITLSADTGTVTTSTNTTFTATVASDINLTATSGNTDIATVSSDGGVVNGDNKVYTFTVAGAGEGSTTISVVNGANQYDKADFVVTVTA